MEESFLEIFSARGIAWCRPQDRKCCYESCIQNTAFPVDTHIHRLAQRWKLTNGKSVEQTEKDLRKLYNPNDWENFIYKL